MTKTLLIIPAYNEGDSLKKIASSLKSFTYDKILINDGSEDDTKAQAEKLGFKVIDLANNLGIGGAVQTGFIYAKEQDYDFAIQVDGDGQHNPAEIEKLFKEMKKTKSDVVIGSRFMKGADISSTTRARLWGIMLLNSIIWATSGLKIKDSTSGFRLYNKKAIDYLSSFYPEDYPEPEAIVALAKHGFKISEVGVKMEKREIGKSSISPLKSVFYIIKVSFSIIVNLIRNKEYDL